MSDFLVTLMAKRQYTLEASNLPLHKFQSGSAGTIIISDGDFVTVKDEDGGTVFYHAKSVSDASKTVVVTIKDNDACTHSVITVKMASGKKYVSNFSGTAATFGSNLIGGVVENKSSGHIVVPGNVTAAINYTSGTITIQGNAGHIVNHNRGRVDVHGFVTGNILNSSSGKVTVRGKRSEVETESKWKDIISWVCRAHFGDVTIFYIMPVFFALLFFTAHFLNKLMDKF